MRRKIKRNRIQCRYCGDIIESVSRHDYVTCRCGKVAVDGGKDYLRRACPSSPEEDYTELSEFFDMPEDGMQPADQ